MTLGSMVLLLGTVGLSLSLFWFVSRRLHRDEPDRMQARVLELETMLALQERKLEHLTAYAEQMQESEAGTRAIIDNALDGIITIDNQGRIVAFNPAAEKMFGFEREEVLGQRVEDRIVPPSLCEGHRRGLEHFLATGEGKLIGQRVETVGLRKDGQQFPIDLAITVLHPQRPPLLTAYVRDLSPLKQTAQKLAQSDSRLQAILDAATQIAIIANDPDGKITVFNRGAELMLGHQAKEVLGVDSVKLLHVPEEIAKHARLLTEELGEPLAGFQALTERARRGSHEEREWTFRRKDGSCLTVSKAITALRDEAGQIIGFLGVATDVTERRRTALTLQRAKEAAEAANRAKSDFLANMSHEIRTPMNGILGMTQLALDTALTVEQRDYLQMVKSSADSLLTVINDILDFSKIEAGKLDLDAVEFELRDMVADTLRSLGLRADAKDLELACHVPADVPDFVIGDPIRLRQVLINLVGNAIKFTERGEVVVLVQVEQGAEGDNADPLTALTLRPGGDIRLHFTVSDTGIGIAPEKLPYIFDAFVQVDSSATRKHGGTGLGLTITGRLVEMMGGRLWAESEPGRGSMFHFTVQLKLQDRSPSRLLPRRPSNLQGLSVLVVDDNATNRRIMEEMLTSWLLKVRLADGADTALAELEAAAAVHEPFPLVLLDAHMPGQDGFALAAEIRRRSHLANPKLLMLSSAGRADDYEKCRALDIGQRLIKPVKPSDLMSALLRMLDVSPSSSGIHLRPSLARSPSKGVVVAMEKEDVRRRSPDGRGLRVLLAEDNIVNQQLVLAILEKKEHRVVVVDNGAAAVRAVRQEPFDLILMDVQMPQMNGLEATRAIRALEREGGSHVPIVAMTAHAMKGAREECLQAGMDAYLSKPVQMADLVDVLEELTCPSAEASPQVSFDPEPLRRRIGGDEELFRELIALFKKDGPRMLEQVREGIAAGDAPAVESAAHLLKGSAGNFGADQVVHAAQRVEDLGHAGDLKKASNALKSLEESLRSFLGALEGWLGVHPLG